MDTADMMAEQEEDYEEEEEGGYERGIAREYGLDSDASDDESEMVVLDPDHVSPVLYCLIVTFSVPLPKHCLPISIG